MIRDRRGRAECADESSPSAAESNHLGSGTRKNVIFPHHFIIEINWARADKPNEVVDVASNWVRKRQEGDLGRWMRLS